MKPEINLITIWTEDIEAMKDFYSGILGFEIINDLGEYVEFENSGVRFAVCVRSVMYPYSDEFRERASGQNFELAFPCGSVEELDADYRMLMEKGVKGIHEPENMPWKQRTALFADPEGNIHELFTEL
jgi:catechol 2,3-dioxygenase-like lactoylglutathione lyase family enzyme